MRVSFASGDGASARGSNFCGSLPFARGIELAYHVAKKIGNVKTRSLDFAQLIGKKEIEYGALFVIVGEASNRFIGNSGARGRDFTRDCFSRRVVLCLLQTPSLNSCGYPQSIVFFKPRVGGGD